MPGLLFKEPLAATAPAEVCPVCFKLCPLFKRLRAVAMDDEVRRESFAQFHHPVCPACKKRRCNGTVQRGKRQGEPCREKKVPRNKELPPWWFKYMEA